MPRIARVVATDYPHHITQRGNYRQTVFSKDSDYFLYLKWTNEYSKKYEFQVLAYCLMPNHIHFVGIPKKRDSMARTFNVSHMRYSQYFNKANNINGHLWQGRFFSCVLDERHLYAACRYVENNPVRSGLVEKAADWRWSSARAHLYKEKSVLAIAEAANYLDVEDWDRYLSAQEDKKATEGLRSNTLSGRPLGGDVFLQELEERFGKSLNTRRKGRPRKQEEKIGAVPIK